MKLVNKGKIEIDVYLKCSSRLARPYLIWRIHGGYMSLRWTSYLHVSHNPVLALVGKRAVGSKSAINENVAEARCSKHTMTSFEQKLRNRVSRCEKIVNWDVSFHGSGAQGDREFTKAHRPRKVRQHVGEKQPPPCVGSRPRPRRKEITGQGAG
jgi:hypothetical protein